MGEVYVVVEYVDDVEIRATSILAVYTHEEQAMKHALTFIDQDTIGTGSEYVDPPSNSIIDAQVLQDPIRRIAIVTSPFIVGGKHQQVYDPDRNVSVGKQQDLDINDPFNPDYDAYSAEEDGDYFGTEIEL